MIGRLLILGLTFFLSLTAISQEPEHSGLIRHLDSQINEQNGLLVDVIHQEISHRFKQILYVNPHVKDNLLTRRSIRQSRNHFRMRYEAIFSDLAHQDEAPFTTYSEVKKIRLSIERLVYQSISTDPDSTFYGITDDVYDEAYADSDIAVEGFSNLTYEPLLQTRGAVILAVPLAGLTLALMSRWVRPVRGGRLIFSVAASVAALLAISGCSGTDVVEFYQSQDSDTLLHDLVTIHSLWQHIGENIADYVVTVEKTTHSLITNNADTLNPDNDFTETMYRQLYSTIFVTAVAYMRPYFLDEELQKRQNYLYATTLPRDNNLNRDLKLNYELLLRPANEMFSSFQVNVIWEAFSSFVRYFHKTSAFRNVFLKGTLEFKKTVIRTLYALYKDYEVIWNINEFLVAQIKHRYEEHGIVFHDDQFAHRLDWQTINTFISGFDSWITAAEPDPYEDTDFEDEESEDEPMQDMENRDLPLEFPENSEDSLPDGETFQRSYFTNPPYERNAQLVARRNVILDFLSLFRAFMRR